MLINVNVYPSRRKCSLDDDYAIHNNSIQKVSILRDLEDIS